MRSANKSASLFLIILLAASSPIMIKPAGAQTAPTATALNASNTPPAGALIVPDQYPTIQDAIENAAAGDTVFVRAGVYYNDGTAFGYGITINKTLSLIGEDSETTILKPNYTSHYGMQAGILIAADAVTISGFTIDGAADNSTLEGVFSNNPVVGYQENGVLIFNESFPLSENVPSGCKIIGNNIINNGIGIQDNGKNDVISGNNVANDDSGIELNLSGSIIFGNNVTEMRADGRCLLVKCHDKTK